MGAWGVGGVVRVSEENLQFFKLFNQGTEMISTVEKNVQIRKLC